MLGYTKSAQYYCQECFFVTGTQGLIMSFADLSSFISRLEKCSELDRIKVQVDPHLEAAAIIDRVCKSKNHNRALLFEKITGSSIPLVANLFGSQRRVAMALGVDDIEELSERLRLDKIEPCR